MAKQRNFDDQNYSLHHVLLRLLPRRQASPRQEGRAFTEIDVSCDLALRQEIIDRAYGRRTVPQIFIDGSHFGGYEELAELERAAKLDPLLAEIAAASAPGG